MKITGTYMLHSPRDEVWPLINNPVSLVRLIPGCEQLEEAGPTEYRGQMQIPVPAVAGTYATLVRLLASDEPYLTRFEGEMDGPAGAIRGNASFHLLAEAGNSVLIYEGQGIITGPLGRMDGRFTEGVARSLISQGLANLDRQLQEAAAGVGQSAVPAIPAAGPGRRFTAWTATAGNLLGRLIARIRVLLGLGTRQRDHP